MWFMTLSALVTARNIPLSSWSKITFNNVLLQGDRLYLKALNTGLLELDPCVDFLSVEDLPKVISVSILTNDFLFEIIPGCQSITGTVSPRSPVHDNITTLLNCGQLIEEEP